MHEREGTMDQLEGKRVLLLSSGGPDSACAAKMVQEHGAENVAALYLKSGNLADEQEIAAAKEMCASLGIPMNVVDISDAVAAIGGGALMRHAGSRLVDFGPAIMMSLAVGYAMSWDFDYVAVGLHKDDSEAGPQYRPEYIEQFNALVDLAGPRTPRVVAPLIGLRKFQVIERANSLGVDLAETWSCTGGGATQCGACGACLARKNAFAEAGLVDPTVYAERAESSATVRAG
jgi:7-cyano-7-deazaguanine synthase